MNINISVIVQVEMFNMKFTVLLCSMLIVEQLSTCEAVPSQSMTRIQVNFNVTFYVDNILQLKNISKI
uniref:Neur_chan_LBD domain-containing protein n=1 Tax=Ascaris lumbricoides TaxID=6252 RepID=A0A0M3ITF5_ASCLU